MRTVFADTFYWVALINPTDQWYSKVMSVSEALGENKIVTTDEVLVEVLAFYSKSGDRMRKLTNALVKNILNNPNIQMEQTHQSFIAGFRLYESRLDKGYSLTDCISMNTMRQLNILEVLTHDKHFTQEGFVILFDS